MKKILTAVCLVAFITPAFAADFDKKAYNEARKEWKADWKATENDWKADGKPQPKPERPEKPSKADY